MNGVPSSIGGHPPVPSPARLRGERVRVRGDLPKSCHRRSFQDRSPLVSFTESESSRSISPLTLTLSPEDGGEGTRYADVHLREAPP